MFNHFPRESDGHRDQSVRDVDTRGFHCGISALDVLRALRASRQRQRPLSLTVQWPTRLGGPNLESYFSCLLREIDLIGCHLGAEQRVQQVQLAGAAPDSGRLQRLMARLRKRFNLIECADFAVEVDLYHSDWATMGALREQGFNHVSIGAADSDSLWSATGYSPAAPVHSLIDAARAFGYRSVNVDLGYGHPMQTPERFAEALSALVALEPDRLRVFDYGRRTRTGACSPQDAMLMRRICAEQLNAAGYLYLGLGQFVRPDDDLAMARERGRLHYSCDGFSRHAGCDHVGFGLGAISRFAGLQGQNSEALEDYLQKLRRDQLATWRGKGGR